MANIGSRATYSTSEIESGAVGYFFDIHVKVMFPIKNMKPLVLFRSSVSLRSHYHNI